MLNQYYVYAYLDPRKPSVDSRFTHEPFYIGRGSGSRLTCHLKEATNLPDTISRDYYTKHRINMIKVNKIRSMLRDGYEPIIVKVIERLTLEESKLEEMKLIGELGRSIFGEGPLTNLTAGGEGRHVCHAGRFNPFYGRTHTIEVRQQLSDLHKGKIISTDHRLAVSEKLKGVKNSNETVEKRRTYMRKLQNENPSNPILTRLGDSRSKIWKLQTPTGDIIEVFSLRKFCKENGLNPKTLLSARKHNRATKTGWSILDCITQ